MSKKHTIQHLTKNGARLDSRVQKAFGHYIQRAKAELRKVKPDDANTYSGVQISRRAKRELH
jgi:hypothetical protein